MCTWVIETAKVIGSGKGPPDWMRVETANVYFDHPAHALLDHALCIDFVGSSGDGARIAVELSAESARDLIVKIKQALDRAGD